MSRVVIAGAGHLGRQLAERLGSTHQVHLANADLTAVPEAEVACAGADTIVFLARASKRIARLPRAEPADVNRLLADSVARAAKAVRAKHLVSFACGPDDPCPQLLAHSGVPSSVLRGGGPDPVELLANLVTSGPGAPSLETPAWTGPEQEARAPRFGTCSIQRYRRPPGVTALELARRYFEWLPGDMRLVKTSERDAVFTLTIAGIHALVLRYVSGRSSDDLAWFEIADGRMARRSSEGRFEFRHLLDGQHSMAALVAYEPALPFWMYRVTQAVLHERVMRRFGESLEAA